MAKFSPNQDDTLYNLLIALKRHLGSCRECKAARKSNNPHDMCNVGIFMVMGSADRFDNLITLRRAAMNGNQPTIFACPDLSKHGKSYALLASPQHVVAVQDRLW